MLVLKTKETARGAEVCNSSMSREFDRQSSRLGRRTRRLLSREGEMLRRPCREHALQPIVASRRTSLDAWQSPLPCLRASLAGYAPTGRGGAEGAIPRSEQSSAPPSSASARFVAGCHVQCLTSCQRFRARALGADGALFFSRPMMSYRYTLGTSVAFYRTANKQYVHQRCGHDHAPCSCMPPSRRGSMKAVQSTSYGLLAAITLRCLATLRRISGARRVTKCFHRTQQG